MLRLRGHSGFALDQIDMRRGMHWPRKRVIELTRFDRSGSASVRGFLQLSERACGIYQIAVFANEYRSTPGRIGLQNRLDLILLLSCCSDLRSIAVCLDIIVIVSALVAADDKHSFSCGLDWLLDFRKHRRR